jgi:hypothetical protein
MRRALQLLVAAALLGCPAGIDTGGVCKEENERRDRAHAAVERAQRDLDGVCRNTAGECMALPEWAALERAINARSAANRAADKCLVDWVRAGAGKQ